MYSVLSPMYTASHPSYRPFSNEIIMVLYKSLAPMAFHNIVLALRTHDMTFKKAFQTQNACLRCDFNSVFQIVTKTDALRDICQTGC